MRNLTSRLSRIFNSRSGLPKQPHRDRPARRPILEVLEGRKLLAGGVGTDYTLMGGKWDNSKTITFSIAPDGVSWDQGTNSINGKLDAAFGGTSWHDLVAKALQTWSASTNLNFALVNDSNADFNAWGGEPGGPEVRRYPDRRL